MPLTAAVLSEDLIRAAAASAPITESSRTDDLDAESRGTLSWRHKPVTLRWVLMHLIEETARHNGHIDILREMADGLTGR